MGISIVYRLSCPIGCITTFIMQFKCRKNFLQTPDLTRASSQINNKLRCNNMNLIIYPSGYYGYQIIVFIQIDCLQTV